MPPGDAHAIPATAVRSETWAITASVTGLVLSLTVVSGLLLQAEGLVGMDLPGLIALSAAGAVVVVSAIALPLLLRGRAHKLRRILLLLASPSTVHWTYSAEEWGTFTDGERRRGIRAALIGPPLAWAVALGARLGSEDPLGTAVAWLPAYAAVTCLTVAGALVAVAGVRARRRRQVGTALFGPGAVYFDGRFVDWRAPRYELLGVVLLPGPPPCLEVHISGPTLHERSDVRVLVPAGREDEARSLAQRIQRG